MDQGRANKVREKIPTQSYLMNLMTILQMACRTESAGIERWISRLNSGRPGSKVGITQSMEHH